MAERRSRRGIEIPDEVAQAASLPEDLDSSVIGPYAFPSPARRRNAAWIYLGGAVVAGSGAIAGLTAGLWVAAGLLVVLAVWNLAAAWPLRIGDTEALEIANREAAFTVGHASAAVGFDGWRSRPVWTYRLPLMTTGGERSAGVSPLHTHVTSASGCAQFANADTT